jgi:hypothetical protein
MSMSFSNRIKKEMTEGIVRAILEDAQYRVIDSGIEKVLRELACMSAEDYCRLGYPDAMSRLPDFTVMDRDQTTKHLVEVKYRSNWGRDLLEEVREQVRLYGEIVLVCINATAKSKKGVKTPSLYLRCCGLKFDGGDYMVHHYENPGDTVAVWKPLNTIDKPDENLWWAMLKLQDKFTQLNEDKNKGTLMNAVNALAGILDDVDEKAEAA